MRLPSLRQIWSLVKQAVSAWLDDYAPSMGAALSYYTVFSLAPMLLIVIAVAGLVFGEEAARGALFEQLRGLMGADAARAVEGLLASTDTPTRGVWATVTGVAVVLVGATTVFGELHDAMNRIWEVPQDKQPGGLWGLLRTRLLSFGMILGIAFLLMVSLVVSAAVSALGTWWSPFFGAWEWLAQAVTFFFGLAVGTVGFAAIYKYMPSITVKWRDVWIGAFVTAVLFSLGRFAISLYIGKSGVASGFGAAGSVVVVFVWVYYSAQIFLLGAEFTWAYATTLGSMKQTASAGATANANDAKATAAAPSRSEEIPVPLPATAPRPVVVAPAMQAARAPTPAASRADTLLGAGLAAGVVMRYAIPWFLRRLGRRLRR